MISTLLFVMAFLMNVQGANADFANNYNEIVDMHRSGVSCDKVMPKISQLKEDLLHEGSGRNHWRKELYEKVIENFSLCFKAVNSDEGITTTVVYKTSNNKPLLVTDIPQQQPTTSSSTVTTTKPTTSSTPVYSSTQLGALPSTKLDAIILQSSAQQSTTPTTTTLTNTNACELEMNKSDRLLWGYLALAIITGQSIAIGVGIWYIKKLIIRKDQLKGMAHRRHKYAKKWNEHEDNVQLTIINQ